MLIKNKKNKSFTTGFTLIELLVVVAIISLLSSVVMASLTTARVKAKNSAAKKMAQEYRTLMELEISENGSGDKLRTDKTWVASPVIGNCDLAYSTLPPPAVPSNYASKAIEICTKLVELKAGSGFTLHVQTNSTSKNYRIITTLKSSYFCLDGRGRVDEMNAPWAPTPGSVCDNPQ